MRERQHVGLGLAQHRGHLRKRRCQGVGDPVPLRGDLVGICVGEDGLDRRSHRRGVLGRDGGVQVAHEVHPAPLPR